MDNINEELYSMNNKDIEDEDHILKILMVCSQYSTLQKDVKARMHKYQQLLTSEITYERLQ